MAQNAGLLQRIGDAFEEWRDEQEAGGGGGGGGEPIVATGAVAGTPGHFTPTGAEVPANLAALNGGSITASPNTAWTTGQNVALGTGTAHWNGTTYATGAAA